MFEQTATADFGRLNRTWSTLAGMTAQAALVSAAIMAPMMFPEALPNYRSLVMQIFVHEGPPPPPPPPGNTQPRPATGPKNTQYVAGKVFVPATMPAKPSIIVDEVAEAPTGPVGSPLGVKGGVEGGVPNGVLGSLFTGSGRFAAPPQPAAASAVKTAPAAQQAAQEPPRIRVGGVVQDALVVSRVIPTYPRLAVQARISGDVQLIGVVGTDGRVRELKVLSGHPLLVGAALDAVRQWLYRPTLLNGDPVEVVAPITVHFTLQ